jgi:mannose-1-phosphate guanylyltransferase
MTHQPSTADQGQVWAVVLAGGEGIRLQPLIRRLYGEERPKQYAALLGGRSLVRQTLDRIRPVVPSARTVIVTHRDRDRYLHEALDGATVRRILVQPEDRGTAAGVLLPCHWIHWADPDAIIAVFPSDHFVGNEQVFREHVTDMVEVIRDHPGWIVLMGASPTDPDPDYGWVEPGELVGWSPAGTPISRVGRFWEKPSPLTARACVEKGWLWNTFIFVARAALILEVGARLLGQLHERLSRLSAFWDTEDERWALQQAYALSPNLSFSHAVLEQCPPGLVLSRLPAISWSDWGTPERVIASLKNAGLDPGWLSEWDPSSRKQRCCSSTR